MLAGCRHVNPRHGQWWSNYRLRLLTYRLFNSVLGVFSNSAARFWPSPFFTQWPYTRKAHPSITYDRFNINNKYTWYMVYFCWEVRRGNGGCWIVRGRLCSYYLHYNLNIIKKKLWPLKIVKESHIFKIRLILFISFM